MTSRTRLFTGGPIFDGIQLHEGRAARFENGVFAGLEAQSGHARADKVTALDGDVLCLGYTDLQVNGGDGIMFNDAPDVATLARMAQAHRRLGATRILPTLITDSVETTHAAIRAATDAIAQGISGIAGLHLEGPHLSVARKGAHDAQFIRPMESADLTRLLEAKSHLPVLKVTLAPESTTSDQVKVLSAAGILVSLGHTDADYTTCLGHVAAGARRATHLFNAMSQMDNRAPGLVGVALDNGLMSAGLIADAIHVHPATMRVAWRSKIGPGRIFLVSDAMAVTGTQKTEFKLNGRTIKREAGQLRLTDGTLAGADLDLTRAVSVLVNQVDVPLPEALAAATSGPAMLCGLADHRLEVGRTTLSDMIRIRADLSGAEPILP